MPSPVVASQGAVIALMVVVVVVVVAAAATVEAVAVAVALETLHTRTHASRQLCLRCVLLER